MAGWSWFGQAGGVIGNGPRPLSGRYLSQEEREEIAVGLAAGWSLRRIAVGLGRAVSTVSREVSRNQGWRGRYRAYGAQQLAVARARRPKPAKLAVCTRLREVVQQGLTCGWSPEQIAARLGVDYPDDAEMRVSHETIYQSLYVQSRGALRRELAACLRTGRALRKPRRHGRQRRSRLPGMVNISDRPPQVEDRAVPGHWEGDLIIGKAGKSAIGTLVERSSRFCLLVHLPYGHDALEVRDGLLNTITALPDQLRGSLTWDQGREMAHHRDISLAAGIDIYFCDPHSPWQRGSNENTNGLLRQYFPKGTDLSTHDAGHLDVVAALLNGRPRKTLGWATPAEVLTRLLSSAESTVATTG
jgi:IS30 family transposase